MPFTKTRQAGLPNSAPADVYAANPAGTFQHDFAKQVRLNGGAHSPCAADSDLMGPGIGRGTKLDTRAQGVAPAKTIPVNNAAPMKRTVVSKTTAAAQHLAAKRWGVK